MLQRTAIHWHRQDSSPEKGPPEPVPARPSRLPLPRVWANACLKGLGSAHPKGPHGHALSTHFRVSSTYGAGELLLPSSSQSLLTLGKLRPHSKSYIGIWSNGVLLCSPGHRLLRAPDTVPHQLVAVKRGHSEVRTDSGCLLAALEPGQEFPPTPSAWVWLGSPGPSQIQGWSQCCPSWLLVTDPTLCHASLSPFAALNLNLGLLPVFFPCGVSFLLHGVTLHHWQ